MYEDIEYSPIFRPRSSSGGNHHDFSHSPRLGRSSRRLHSTSDRTRPTNSDASIYSSECDEHKANGDCNREENAFSVQKGIEQIGNECKNMALSAVMMSGGRGGKNSSHRNITDIDSPWVEDPHSKCVCDRIRSKETVIINVGGTVFETYKSTLKRLRSCRLSNDQEMLKYYRENKGDYFFDRDPFAFNIILNYLRYGDLHLPTHLCGPALMREFEFWGIEEQEIERCCFQPYNTWKTQTKSLEKLEYDRKFSTTQTDLTHDRNSKKLWRRFRAVVWTFLQDPNSSVAAKVYAWISIIFVFMSIFSFCAETHPDFQLPPEDVHDFRILYQFFTLESKQIHSTGSGNGVSSVGGKNNATLGNVSDIHNSSETMSRNDDMKLQHPALLIIDLVCVFFFTVEFLTRLLFCPKKLRFCRSLQNIIDFVAIVPDYVEFIILAVNPSGRQGLAVVEFIFILRMLRLCRIFRLIRHVPGLWILLYTLKASFNELLLMFVFLLIGMVVFASLVHFAEPDDKFNNIPVGFWWAVVTMTTVGYGDMAPKSAFGYVIGSICAISGLLMIAFTVPIIVSNFVLYYTHVQYGISDKDSKCSRIAGHDEVESCSLHTTFTETSETRRRQKPTEDTPRVETPTSSLSMDSNSNKVGKDGKD